MPQVQVIPTGGVSLNNVAQWIKAGCLSVGVGGQIIAGPKTGDYAQVSDRARQFVTKIKEARQ